MCARSKREWGVVNEWHALGARACWVASSNVRGMETKRGRSSCCELLGKRETREVRTGVTACCRHPRQPPREVQRWQQEGEGLLRPGGRPHVPWTRRCCWCACRCRPSASAAAAACWSGPGAGSGGRRWPGAAPRPPQTRRRPAEVPPGRRGASAHGRERSVDRIDAAAEPPALRRVPPARAAALLHMTHPDTRPKHTHTHTQYTHTQPASHTHAHLLLQVCQQAVEGLQDGMDGGALLAAHDAGQRLQQTHTWRRAGAGRGGSGTRQPRKGAKGRLPGAAAGARSGAWQRLGRPARGGAVIATAMLPPNPHTHLGVDQRPGGVVDRRLALPRLVQQDRRVPAIVGERRRGEGCGGRQRRRELRPGAGCAVRAGGREGRCCPSRPLPDRHRKHTIHGWPPTGSS